MIDEIINRLLDDGEEHHIWHRAVVVVDRADMRYIENKSIHQTRALITSYTTNKDMRAYTARAMYPE